MTVKASEVLFNSEASVATFRHYCLEGAAELGGKIDDYLVEWAKKGGYNVIR